MKNLNMISRRSFLKAALAASAVSAMALTGCGGAASGSASGAAVSSSAAASGSAAAAGETFKVGIVNYVDHASLNQIVESVESRLDAIGKEKGVTFDYADYYANAQADQSNLNQIGADLVADGVDVIVAVATPTAATMLAAVEDTDIPVVYSAVTDPAAAGFDGEENITGTSDALNTDAIMNLIVAANPGIDTIGLLYDLSQDASTEAIADAKAFCEKNGIKVVENPVAIGQSQIQNDEVDIPRARKVSESRRSRGCLARTIAVHVKGTRNQIAHRRVILHNEDNALISIAQRPHSLPRRRQPEPLRAALPREERTRTRNRADRHRATRYHCRAPLR